MALDPKKSVYEIAIEIGGKLKQSLRNATGMTKTELDGLEKSASRLNGVMTGIKTLIGGAIVAKGVSWLKDTADNAIEAASEMESYRATLNTVLRDEEKAGKMMAWATDFAAHTPFSQGDIVDAVTRLEAYGFKSQIMMENIGNMASAMNKDLPTAVEAVYKATLGEMELMENNFAITKKLIGEKSQEWYGQAAVNASGAIANAELYNNTLLRLIEEKFEGGMERMSKTHAGIMSNIEDSKDAILRKVIGMDEYGKATENGAYGKYLTFLDGVGDRMENALESGKLDEWAVTLGEIADGAIPKIESFIDNSLPGLVESGGKLAGSAGSALTAIDNLFRELNGGRGALEVIADLSTSVFGGSADLINAVTDFIDGKDSAGTFAKKAEVAILGEENMLKSIRENSKTLWKDINDSLNFIFVGSSMYGDGMALTNQVLNAKPFSTPIYTNHPPLQSFSSGDIHIHVTTAPGADANEIGRTVGDQVYAAIVEAQHQARRTRLTTATAK